MNLDMICQETEETNRGLLDFLDQSPVSFFAVHNFCKMLQEQGAEQLYEGEQWQIEPGKRYYVTRNDSALIALAVPKESPKGIQIMASHCDSPTFKIKTNPEIKAPGGFVTLNIEKYGGMICESWMDRPLSVAGRIVIRTKEGVETRLVCVDRDLLIIPRLAIHMNREVNDGVKINVQKDMLPVFAMHSGSEALDTDGTEDTLMNLVAREAGVLPGDILDTDLYLYNRTKGSIFGLHQEFIASGRLDDLQCAYASMQGFLQAVPTQSIAVNCIFDNEEVGSGTKQGAAADFLSETLRRVNACLCGTEEDYAARLQSSFLVSADNAHSIHPNYPEKCDPTNQPSLNGGIVIKYSANQKYTTDAVSGALFREICGAAGVPVQTFHNRSDQPGGSTLGNISTAQVAVNSVDIGLPQLAMHSAYETAGARDTAYLIRAATLYFSSAILGRGDGSYRLILPESIR